MKIIYKTTGRITRRFLSLALVLTGIAAFAQTSYTFTSCGVTGRLGPSQAQVNTAYAATNLNGSVTSVAGIQQFTVPNGGTWRFELYGASGGTNTLYSGFGAYAAGEVTLNAGTVVSILVGQMGSMFAPTNSDGGGGATFAATGGTLLFAAGGGGGAAQSSLVGMNAQTSTMVVNGVASQFGSSGASYNVNGTNFTYGPYTTVAQAFTNGGNGQAGGQAGGWPGNGYGDGGFGGGGSSCSCSTGGGGGGGGYVGGGGGNCCYTSGYGGSSYTISTAANPSVSVLNTYGNGRLILTSLCNNVPVSPTDATQANNYTVCPGKTTTLSATGSNTITWHPTNTSSVTLATGTDVVTSNTYAPGVYTLWAMNTNTCSSSPRTPVSFTVLAPPAVNVATVNPVCTGYSINLFANGATSYTWSNGANTASVNVLANGQYSVVGLDAATGCTNSAVSTISMLPAPSLTITGPSTICAGGQVALTASGADSYFWNNGSTSNSISLTVNSTTLMSLVGTFTTNGCSTVVQRTVTAFPVPFVNITGATTICMNSGITVTLTASGATDYFWSTGANSNTVAVSPNVSTTYSVVGVYTTGCNSSATAAVTLFNCAGIKTNTAGDESVNVYPNPSNSKFFVEWKNGLAKKYELTDISGRLLMNGTSDKDNLIIHAENLAKGIYYLKLKSEETSQTIKLIRE